jgi:hypothetical protein
MGGRVGTPDFCVHGCDEDEFEGEDVPVVRSGGNMSIAVSEARKAWSSMERRVENASSRMAPR